MRNSPPDDDENRDEERRSSERDDDRAQTPFGLGLGGHIGKLLDFLEENADRGRSRPPGKTPRGSPGPGDPDRFSVDLDVSIGSLGDGESGGRPSGRRRSRRRTRSGTGTDAGEYLTTARRDGEDVVFTVDLPGVDREDVSVGLTPDGDRLLIGAEGSELARVPVDDPEEGAIRPTYNNFVLEVWIDDDALAVEPSEVVDR